MLMRLTGRYNDDVDVIKLIYNVQPDFEKRLRIILIENYNF